MQRSKTPLIAVVRLRKRNDWVLPKGKLNDGETPRDAAEREVLEETGHDVSVHEFLGVCAYEVGGRPKIVHFWRMEAGPEQTHELMADVKAVAWLPLDQAIERLSRHYEQAFLTGIGPALLESASAARSSAAPRRAARPTERPAASGPTARPLNGATAALPAAASIEAPLAPDAHATSAPVVGVAAEPPAPTGELPLPAPEPEEITATPARPPGERVPPLRRAWRWLRGRG